METKSLTTMVAEVLQLAEQMVKLMLSETQLRIPSRVLLLSVDLLLISPVQEIMLNTLRM